MIENVSLDSLKIFYEVAKVGNLTKASEKLFISQPAITQTINKIEEKLNIKLFIRNRKGVALTKQGEEILNRLEFAFSGIKSIDKYLLEEKNLEIGELIIGCGANLLKNLLLSPLREFSQEHPSVNISFNDDVQSDTIKKVINGNVDFCVCQKSKEIYADLIFLPLLKSKYIFACSEQYLKKMSEKHNRTLFLLQGESSFNNLLFAQIAEKHKFKNYSVLNDVGYEMSITLGRGNLGVVFAPEFVLKDYLINKDLIEIKKNNGSQEIIYGIYYNAKTLTNAAKIFLEYVVRNKQN